MARWTVRDGEHAMVVAVDGNRISIDIPTGSPFVTGKDGIRDLRRKLGFAIGEVSGDVDTP